MLNHRILMISTLGLAIISCHLLVINGRTDTKFEASQKTDFKEENKTDKISMKKTQVSKWRQNKVLRGGIKDSLIADVEGICDGVKCGPNKFCVVNVKTQKATCFRLGKRLLHGRSIRKQGGNSTKDYKSLENLREKAQMMKKRMEQAEEKDRATSLQDKTPTKEKHLRLRAKKNANYEDLENMSSEKPVAGFDCQASGSDGTAERLLSRFKDDLEIVNGAKRKKEKRNSTKKELHEEDECRCQATVGWEFQHLDSNCDGSLEEVELSSLVNADSCFNEFLHGCNRDENPSISEKEWCCCFDDALPPCLAKLRSVPYSILIDGKPMTLEPAEGAYVPQCDDDGFYSRVQCHGSTGHCWCVDHNGIQIGHSVMLGTPDCEKTAFERQEIYETVDVK